MAEKIRQEESKQHKIADDEDEDEDEKIFGENIRNNLCWEYEKK